MLSIEYLYELVIIIGRAFYGEPHWMTWFTGAAATLVFAAIAGFSLKAARKANKISRKSYQYMRMESSKNQLAILYAKSNKLYFKCILKTKPSPTEIAGDLLKLYNLLAEQLWAARYPVTHQYHGVRYFDVNDIISNNDKANLYIQATDYTRNLRSDLNRILTLPLDAHKVRVDVERKTFNHLFNVMGGDPLCLKLLEGAMQRLRNNEPYLPDKQEISSLEETVE